MMDIEKIKFLAEILTAHGLTSLEVSEGETKVRLKKEILSQEQKQPIAVTSPEISAPETGAGDQSVDFNHILEVKSPMVGVFYSAPSPDADMFVSIGSKVKKGDVLCIIEAMKLINEITAEQDGEIVDICMKNGDIVEFGQVLFKMF